jgi:hypothetical protein
MPGGGGGALILYQCRAFDLFASVDAHLWLPPHGPSPDLAQRGKTGNPMEAPPPRAYTNIHIHIHIFSTEEVNIFGGEEETGRGGHGAEEEMLSGPELAVAALAGPTLATPVVAAPAVWQMVAPVRDWSVCVE